MDLIKTKIVDGKSVSLLSYSIDKEDRCEDNYKHFYEIRVSYNDEDDNWYTDTEVYLKKDALKIFDIVCKEIRDEKLERESFKFLVNNFLPLMCRRA